MQNYLWPNDFPDDVPPAQDASIPSGLAYRLVNNTPPTSQDFLAYNKEPMNINKFTNKTDLAANIYGTSMYRKKKEIEVTRELYPAQRNKKIAKGILAENFGLISSEKENSHFDLWLQLNTDIEKFFTVIEQD